MSYFKDWQKNRRNIHETLNRLPPEGGQQPQFTNTRADMSGMQREADLELVRE